jgi:hypothetical protein
MSERCTPQSLTVKAGVGLAVGIDWQAGPSAPKSATRASRTPRGPVVASAAIIEHQNRSGPDGQGRVPEFQSLPLALMGITPGVLPECLVSIGLPSP